LFDSTQVVLSNPVSFVRKIISCLAPTVSMGESGTGTLQKKEILINPKFGICLKRRVFEAVVIVTARLTVVFQPVGRHPSRTWQPDCHRLRVGLKGRGQHN